MKTKYPHLFSPYEIRGITFRNRILSAPLGVWVFSPSNYIFDYAISMFENRAKGGAAALTVGHTEINAEEEDTDGFGLYFNLRKREGTSALTEFAAAVQQRGAHASIQINYGGDYGPSEFIRRDKLVKPMTEAKMEQTIQQYADAARKMKLCGFDMLMLHGAHGWLLMQFLSAELNKRTDKYGGSLENRMRFPLMVIDAVRDAVGKDMLIEYRISGFDPKTDPELFKESIAFIKAIENKVDLIHVSSGFLGSKKNTGHTFPTYLDPRGINIDLANAYKQNTRLPVVVVGNITEPEMAEKIIADGKADFVAMCRGLIADPEWPKKAMWSREEDIRPCIGCYNCLEYMHVQHYIGCDVNPRTGREHRLDEVVPAKVSRKVAVVGGGPAGMQAAITAAERGHNVTLYEKSAALGGLLKISDQDPVKYRLKAYKDYLVRQVEKHGIEVKLNTLATPPIIKADSPDVVIIAAGSYHIIPNIPGVTGRDVMTAVEAHQPAAKIGKRVVIIGGNLVGCETALFVRSLGKEVTVAEMTEKLYTDANFAIAPAIQAHLDNNGVHCLTGAKCVAISNQGVHIVRITNNEEKTEIIPADSVILAVGMQPNKDTVKELSNSAVQVIPVGDCIHPGTVRQASRTGYFAALDI
jgi:2,4-dienoyl-CoA reductase-like NADH-dependent reductase (Old Yellow Enzyme family)/thioredoxin reductase